MEISTVVNSDGTITIPAKIRETFGIPEGAKVECIMNGMRLEMRVMGTKLPIPKSKPASGYGMIKSNRPSVPVDLNIGDHIKP
ncbi:AbrB/MazE/SpoVT family DNA-binding domain-containing protein [Duganella sp. S19_KUP01_CR8]|uniref:AbrB/MazE/SpoVT family DNA-binding domain-containing protein n=1 Tax=Duganella sp. S19_KUP01_CR8 TaxID=3025502 RepID=UPI002FCDDBCD